MAEEAPVTMLSLDMWLPPSYQLDTWGLLDAGQLGPAIRYDIPPSYQLDTWGLLDAGQLGQSIK